MVIPIDLTITGF